MRSLPFGKPIIGGEEEQAVLEVLRSGTLVHGPKAKEFETQFAQYTGAPHAVSVGSCTAGLHLAYFAKGIGAGDEVIVPAQTHTATAHAVELTGAKPVFVDAESVTGNIDIGKIEEHITQRTRAISVVHFLGMPVDMDRVLEIAKKHHLFVVEDCALAIGSRYKGEHTGLRGDVGCFSFYPVKHMTTAEGGMVITKDLKLAEQVSRQKAFGVDRTVGERKIPGAYDVTGLGFNYRMNELAAALGSVQLKRMDGFLEIRKKNYLHLAGLLNNIEGVTLLESSHGEYESSYYCLSIILGAPFALKRFEIAHYLKEHGVGTSVYYPKPVPHLEYYRKKYGYMDSDFPIASWISNNSIALPVGPHLGDDDMNYIAAVVKEAIVKL
ncbi:DegT/DnrJ/EryC1/StrS family aminotransferase [Candidatus Uhrbacteria bacterium]|nr:DegT/DnrJ/EryC1/StrS family aminotransferase [Candidatus Uhrbacteria bacterium]